MNLQILVEPQSSGYKILELQSFAYQLGYPLQYGGGSVKPGFD